MHLKYWISGFGLGWISALLTARLSLVTVDVNWARWVMLSLLLALAAGALLAHYLPDPTALRLLPSAALASLTGLAPAPLAMASQRSNWPLTGLVGANGAGTASPPAPVRSSEPGPAPGAGEGTGPTGAEAPQPDEPTDLERLLDRIGERYLADLRELHDAFEQVYAPQLAEKEAEAGRLREQIARLERERDDLTLRVAELEQARTRLIADVEAMRDDLSGKLAAFVAALDEASVGAPQPGDRSGSAAAAATSTGSGATPGSPPAGAPPAGAPPSRTSAASSRRSRR
jgi:hypothetical protein